MATIKELEARLAVAKTARERAEISAGIAFLRKQEESRANAAVVARAHNSASARFHGVSE